jgi:fructokinase
MKAFKLGIDLGGTKLESVLLDSTGRVIYRQRIESPADDYQAILNSIKYLSRNAEQLVGQQLALGIGTPGALSPQTGLLRNSNTVCMNGKNLLKDLEQVVKRPIRIANDANCFVLSEAMDGAAADFDMVFGVIIGTGTGGGLVWHKHIITGPHAIAGEWGHNPLPWLKTFDVLRECYCGKQGCIETFLSGPGMAGNTKALTGKDLSSREIVDFATKGDPTCIEQMDHYYDQMARGLAHVINIVDPDAIVLGGGMSNIEEIYQRVPERLGQYVFSDYVATRLLAPKFGDASGVRGAAWLWQ